MRRFITLFLVFYLIWNAGAATPQDEKDPKKWTIDDVLKQESAGSFDISPDGNWVVWVKAKPNKELDRVEGDIMLTSLLDSTEIQLTRGKYNDGSPKWSPDGKWIAFQTVRGEGKEKRSQIWLINPRGGEPFQLTKMENGINRFEWRDETHLLFTAREKPYLREKELKEKKDDAIVVGDQEHFYPVRLFQICIKEKKVKRLSTNSGRIQEFAVSPDGRFVVTNEAQNIHYPYDYRIPPRQFLYDLQENSRIEIFTEKHMKPNGFVWSRDGKGFFCAQPLASDPEDDYVSVSTLYYFDLHSRKYERVPLKWKWELGSGYHATAEGLLVSLANGPYNKLAFYRKTDNHWQKIDIDDALAKNIYVGDVGPDGRTVVFTYTTASTPPVVKVAKITDHQFSDARKIIQLNSWMKNKYIAKSEVIHWKGALGDQVDGILYYPYNYQPGKRYPLMASIHGGPSGVDRDAFREGWSSYPNILSSRGAFVLKVNYHGSGNYGLRWVESIKGHYYEYEIPDILNGIDYLIDKGLVDPDQLGIMGWSNGAILTTQAVVETDRFKVCAPGAGDVNWTSDYGNCAFGAAFDNAYFGGPPWERPEYYVKKSPFFKLEKVTTPTIIFFGTEDTNVPTEQGWEHYRALQQIGKAPVRFILFPGEPHGLRRLSHQRRKMEEELAWFDKYLFNTYQKENEAFKADSPLAQLLKLKKAQKSDELFGQKVGNVLLPEVVKWEKLYIGRFEVTRAQFAQFDPSYPVPRGTENFPASGISFEQAQAYCSWASKQLGKTVRIPAEKEFQKLLAKAIANADHENNLDYWAGYELNPNEALMLQEKLSGVRPDELLKPVGSFKAFSDAAIYDLAGNVSEWCETESGQGKVLGLSAVSPRDQKSAIVPPDKRFVGFRIVIEQ